VGWRGARRSIGGAVVAFALLAPGAAFATVDNPQGKTLSSTATQTFSGVVATFDSKHSPPALTATINWGDGSAVASGTIEANPSGGWTVNGSHAYGHEGSADVVVFIEDTADKTSGSAKSSMTIGDAPLSATGVKASATQGRPFSGVVANLTDPDGSATPATFTATIDWGDGTTAPGNVASAAGGGFQVSGSHTYSAAGAQPVAVTINDSGGASVQASSTIDIAAPAFGVSNYTPSTGDHVKFDAFGMSSPHGGAIDYRWDINGDGIYERDTHAVPALAVTFGNPGSYPVSVLVTYRDHTTTAAQQTLDVSGAPVVGCALYCHVDFPFHGGTSGGADCQSTLKFGVVDAVGDCIRHVGSVYVADGDIRIDGIDLIPLDPSGHITLDPAAFTVSSSGAPMTVQLGELVEGQQAINWTGLDGGGGGTGGAGARATLPPLPGNGSMEGFPFVGSSATTLTHVISRDPAHPVDHGVASIGAYVQLPDFIGGISVAIALSTDNDNGLALDQVHVHLTNARLKFLPVTHLDFDYDASAARWGGGLQVDTGSYELGATVGLRPVDDSNPNGDLTLDHLSAVVDSLNISITAGVFLQSINAGFTLGPPADIFQGGVSLTEGPKISDISLIQVSGEFTVTAPVPAGGPLDFNLAAELDVLSFKVGTASVDYRTDGNFSFGAHIRLPYWDDPAPPPIARIAADVTGFVDGPHGTWDAEGSANLCLGVCLGVDALASNIAAAGCVNLGIGDAGAAYTWRDGRLVGFGGLGGSCDLSPWRPTHSSAHPSLEAQTITLPAGTHLAAFQVTAKGAPPDVTFAGPHGVTVQTPTDALGSKTAHAWLYKDPSTNTTNVAISGDLAGAWKITPQPGSAPVVSATDSLGRPPVKVSARVGGRDRARTLSYTVAQQAGQKVTFAEVSKKASKVIGSARGSHGTLRFSPADGPAGRRKVVALVTEHGVPRKQLTVATYVAPGPLRPPPPKHVGIVRTKNALRLSWSASPGAASYDIALTTFNHRKQLFVQPRNKRVLVIPNILSTYTASVAIQGVSKAQQTGKAARKTSRPVRPHKKGRRA
jgi:hypothetical protein